MTNKSARITPLLPNAMKSQSEKKSTQKSYILIYLKKRELN
ncbi:hypothetical protein MNB_SV-6-1621 [hydrothermal vent metagenome]|uniref:Uncharacterized protein n=1 Tax=hydrothermal vent metagenome TaxID=652676 RepID=A0A1W1BC69_9ZZZZ